MENTDLARTLDQLENNRWGAPADDSHLVMTCHALRRKPLRDFTVEDLRIMIGQSIGLPYLIPLALDQLEADILAEGAYYAGDLLHAVFTSSVDFWLANPQLWERMCGIYETQAGRLSALDHSLLKRWRNEYAQFKSIVLLGGA